MTQEAHVLGAAPGRPPLLDELRAATAHHHARAEASAAIAAADATLDDYARFLDRMHGFLSPLEDRVGTALGAEAAAAVGWTRRRRTSRLRADLGMLAGRGAPVTWCVCPDDKLSPLGSTGEALGALYVLEGSRLGGQVLARRFATRWGLAQGEAGLLFLHGDGAQTGSRWRWFGAWLSAWSHHGADRTAVRSLIKGAQATFDDLCHWLESPTGHPGGASGLAASHLLS